MESNRVLSSSPDCASCAYRAGHAHKTLEERIIEFYGHTPSEEEIRASYPKIISWGGVPVEDGVISWGPPVGNEIW